VYFYKRMQRQPEGHFLAGRTKIRKGGNACQQPYDGDDSIDGTGRGRRASLTLGKTSQKNKCGYLETVTGLTTKSGYSRI